jgi:hypothetical protein
VTKDSSNKNPPSEKRQRKASSATTPGSKRTKPLSQSQPGLPDSSASTLKGISTKSPSTGKLKKISLKNVVTIPEYVVRQAAEYLNEMYPDEPNSYNTVLEEAEEYYKADMTPLFFLDREQMVIVVAAEETLGKVLH